MKNIFKTLIPCLVLAVGFTGCYDEMDDKASIDAKYALANTPAVTLSGASALDYASASVAASVSDVEGVIEVGFMVATTSDFAGAKYYKQNVAASIEMVLSGLTELTTYNVKAYACLGDGRIVYSEVSSITTPQAPPLTSELLSGKTYSATVTDYWNESYTFEVTLVADASDENKIYIQNLDPYFADYGYVAEEGFNIFEGTLDTEKEIITVPAGQLFGYQDFVLAALDTDDPDEAEDNDSYGQSDLIIKVVGKGASLQFVNAFGLMSGSAWGTLYYGGITLNVK